LSLIYPKLWIMNSSEIDNAADVDRCLHLLTSATVPIVAADLAEKIGLAGSRETQRRKVRAIICYLRENGSMIVADTNRGYFLTKDKKVYQDYLDGKQVAAKCVLGRTGKRKKILRDSQGQGLLFTPGGYSMG